MTTTTETAPHIIRYDIKDQHTGRIVGTAKTRASASRMVDKRDNAYGAYRYTALAVWSDLVMG